jgi:hypothetical protein
MRGMDTEDDQSQKFKEWRMAKQQEEQAIAMPKGHLRHPHGQVQGRQGRHQGT